MADTYKAQLIEGKTYDVMDHIFTLGAERDVKKSVYLYLKDNEQFECKLIKEKTEGEGDGSKDDGENAKASTASAAPKTYTESELRGMTKAGQEDIISDLGGDPAAFKNADERIAFILQKQGE
ncbi:YqbF domain-containing protein [Bacillus licheniformis]|uniref:YqbF domain-containing protein n=1 Tax=Bacillus haynesii TaxID=1925021 RepID=UPI00227EDB8B|nr:YqbF domain-containing protein [Bacillus haynesii]MCY8540118.1 hypothetical protein [Bacillus haynesii]